MYRTVMRIVSIALAAACANAAIWAQEAAPEIPTEPIWDGSVPTLYSKGDKTFVISLGTIVPMLYTTGDFGTVKNNSDIGGAGSLAYNYFLTPHFSLGGEFGGMFSGTVGENMLYIMPFGLKATYQFVRAPFEFPLSLMVGGATQTYLDTDYLGLIVKPGAAVFWRQGPDWSFGLNANWWWVPQWTDSKDTTVFGNFLELTLAARYHF